MKKRGREREMRVKDEKQDWTEYRKKVGKKMSETGKKE